MTNKITTYIDNIGIENDCCGKRDMDSEMISISTRYWPDYTAKCSFIFDIKGNWEDILVSDYIEGNSDFEVESKCRQWYKDNFIKALEIVIGWNKENE